MTEWIEDRLEALGGLLLIAAVFATVWAWLPASSVSLTIARAYLAFLLAILGGAGVYCDVTRRQVNTGREVA